MTRPGVRLIAVSCALLAGCGEGGVPDGNASSSPAPTGGDAGAEAMTAEATLEPRGDGVSLRVVVSGLTPGARYAAHVHQGSCRGGGPVQLPLGRVAARDDGTGSIRMSLDAGRLPALPLFVQVRAPDGPGACADVRDVTTR